MVITSQSESKIVFSQNKSRDIILSVRNIRKSFGFVQALKDVDLDIAKGEVHVLLGENGAGKTTLVNIIYGIYIPDSGEIYINGTPVRIRSPRDAMKYGIALIQQYPMLIERLTVFENLALSLHRIRMFTSPRKVTKLAMAISEKYGIKLDLDVPVSKLSFSEKQQVELLKALLIDARIIILDEPTLMLTSTERRKLFTLLRNLAKEGRSILMITHKVIEAMEVSDWITVLRRGEVVASGPTKIFTTKDLVKLVIGYNNLVQSMEKENLRKVSSRTENDIIIVDNIDVLNDIGEIAVKSLSLRVKSGEILGIAGVAGNGQKELVEAIMGLRKPVKGRIILGGVDVTKKGPRERVKLGVAYIPEERIKIGIAGDLSVAENLVLKVYGKKPFSSLLMLNYKSIENNAVKLIEKFNIITRGPWDKAKVLSGGNIQKLIVARELSLNPKLIIAHNPTLGLDLLSTRIVRKSIIEARERGASILLVSEDLDEVLELSDRVAVMYSGKIVYEAPRSSINIDDIERAMLGAMER